MAKDSEIMVLNDYNGGSLERRQSFRTTGAGNRVGGKARYTISIKSEPLLIETSPRALGAAPAIAIENHLKERVGGISAAASPATVRARKSALAAFVRGETWAQKRYSGGRIGSMPPARSDRLFNDSGRFVKSIKASPVGDRWIVNIAANRLDPSTLNGGEAALVKMLELLRQYVPEFGDARALMDVLSVRRALKDGLAEALQKANERTVELKKQLMQQTVGRLLRLVG